MTKEEFEDEVAVHQLRNKELLGMLRGEYEVDVSKPREIDHHFWAKDKQTADKLSKALSDKGFRIHVDRSTGKLWAVEATVQQSPNEAVADAHVEQLVRIAADAGAQYDGWGT